MGEKTYSTVTINGVDYLEPSAGDTKGFRFQKSHECFACGLDFPESRMKYFRGRWYGIPCKCFKDIYSLLKLEKG